MRGLFGRLGLDTFDVPPPIPVKPHRLQVRHAAHPYYRWAWTVTQGGVRRAAGDAPTWAGALAAGLAALEHQAIVWEVRR